MMIPPANLTFGHELIGEFWYLSAGWQTDWRKHLNWKPSKDFFRATISSTWCYLGCYLHKLVKHQLCCAIYHDICQCYTNKCSTVNKQSLDKAIIISADIQTLRWVRLSTGTVLKKQCGYFLQLFYQFFCFCFVFVLFCFCFFSWATFLNDANCHISSNNVFTFTWCSCFLYYIQWKNDCCFDIFSSVNSHQSTLGWAAIRSQVICYQETYVLMW